MSFEEVQGRLTELFGGAAARNADTYAGKIARVQVAFDEAKETLGTALLPILDKLLVFINDNALPAIEAFSAAFSLTEGDGLGKVMSDVGSTIKKTVQPIFEGVKSVFDSVKTAVLNSKDEFKAFWDVVKFIAPLIGSAIGGAMKVVGDIAEVVITIIAKVLAAIKPLLNTAIDGINLIIKGYNLIQTGKDIPPIQKIGAASTATGALGNFSMSTGTVQTSPTTTVSGGTTGDGSTSGIAGVVASAASAVNNIVSGSFNAGSFRTAEAASSGTTINLTVTGAFDKEGTARTIVDTLNNSFYRGTGGATNLQIA
jgi:phage-related protein